MDRKGSTADCTFQRLILKEATLMTECEHDGVPGGLIGGVSISQEQSIDIYSYISNGAASTYALPD
jgi:hypothetical protein